MKLFVTLTLLALFIGSGYAAEVEYWKGDEPRRPRIRLASSPYPNILFKRLDQMEFGEHHYRPDWRPWKTREISRGHFYTRRGGFIDLSHLRKTVDWAAYFQGVLYTALTNGESRIVIKGSEPSLYHIDFKVPDLPHLSAEEQDDFYKELSIQAGLQLSFTALTWHEILTWYGFSALRVLSEKSSAFSYEDMYTHAVGIAVAEQALRNNELPYNQAVTVALTSEVAKLEPLDGSGTQDALNRVHESWWRYQRTLKRATDIGESGYVAPLLVPGLEHEDPAMYPAPVLTCFMGVELSECITVDIQPVHKAGKFIASMVGRESGMVNPIEDFSMIMTNIRSEGAPGRH